MSSCIHVIRMRPGTPQVRCKRPITRHILYLGKLRLRKVDNLLRTTQPRSDRPRSSTCGLRTPMPTLSPPDQSPTCPWHLAVTLVWGGTLSCSRHQMGYPSLFSFGLSSLSPGKPQSLSLSPQGHGNKHKISFALPVSRGNGRP